MMRRFRVTYLRRNKRIHYFVNNLSDVTRAKILLFFGLETELEILAQLRNRRKLIEHFLLMPKVDLKKVCFVFYFFFCRAASSIDYNFIIINSIE